MRARRGERQPRRRVQRRRQRLLLGIGSALTGIPWAQISGPLAAGSDATPDLS